MELSNSRSAGPEILSVAFVSFISLTTYEEGKDECKKRMNKMKRKKKEEEGGEEEEAENIENEASWG